MTGNQQVYKLAVLGEGGVGKTALALQFVSHVFHDFHDPTIEDAYQVQVAVDGEAVKLDILDTAGQEEFTPSREQYMRNRDGFVLVYSLTDRLSFQCLRNHTSVMERVKHCEKIPVVSVGNKLDLGEDREVTWNRGFAHES